MKFIIGLLNELDLEFKLSRGAGSRWHVRGFFPTFLHRPGKPHVSVFADPNSVVHFTANRGNPRHFRADLTELTTADLNRSMTEVLEAQGLHFLDSLRPAVLENLEDGGWMVHGLNHPVMSRWLRRGIKRGKRLDVTVDHVCTFLSHILRTHCLPTALTKLSESDYFLIMRHEDEKLRVRAIYYFADGFKDSCHRHRPPGWYWPGDDWESTGRERLANMSSPVAPLMEKAKQELERYRRRGQPFEDLPLPDDISELTFALGFYVELLLTASLRLAIQARMDAA